MVLASVCLMAELVMVNPSLLYSRAFTSEMASSNETSTVVALIAVTFPAKLSTLAATSMIGMRKC